MKTFNPFSDDSGRSYPSTSSDIVAAILRAQFDREKWTREQNATYQSAQQIAEAAPQMFQGLIADQQQRAYLESVGPQRDAMDPRMNPVFQAQMSGILSMLQSGNPDLQKAALSNFDNQFNATVPKAPEYTDPVKMLTDDIKEYTLAKQQGFPGSFQDWVEFTNTSRRMQVNVGGTTVNNSPQSPDYEKEYDKQMGKAEVDEFLKLQKAPETLGGQLRSFETINQYLGNRGGFYGSQLAELKAIADRLGIDIAGKDADQAAIALQNQVALDLRSTADGAGMPGAMSDADREFLRKQVPGIDMSPAGRAKLIEVKRRLYQRQLEMRDSAMEYAAKNNGRFDYRYYNSPEYLKLRDKPLFEDIDVVSQNPQPTERVTPSAPPRVSTRAEALALPPGTRFIDPNGIERIR